MAHVSSCWSSSKTPRRSRLLRRLGVVDATTRISGENSEIGVLGQILLIYHSQQFGFTLLAYQFLSEFVPFCTLLFGCMMIECWILFKMSLSWTVAVSADSDGIQWVSEVDTMGWTSPLYHHSREHVLLLPIKSPFVSFKQIRVLPEETTNMIMFRPEYSLGCETSLQEAGNCGKWILSYWGPVTFQGPIAVKLREGKESEISVHSRKPSPIFFPGPHCRLTLSPFWSLKCVVLSKEKHQIESRFIKTSWWITLICD